MLEDGVLVVEAGEELVPEMLAFWGGGVSSVIGQCFSGAYLLAAGIPRLLCEWGVLVLSLGDISMMWTRF